MTRALKSATAAAGNPIEHRLVDFSNLGILLRLLLLVNVLGLATSLIAAGGDGVISHFLTLAPRIELPLIAMSLLLYLMNAYLQQLKPLYAKILILVLTLLVTFLCYAITVFEKGPLWHWLGWAAGAALIALYYFNYLSLLYSPALDEARLMALTSRIRPHFLFNALNSVLGVIRSDPQRAETAIEELAELFRSLMRDNRELVELSHELRLCEHYVDLEKLRLGDRLEVIWEIDPKVSGAVLVPPLLLQPLVENAVYHGIEPSSRAGQIRVRIWRSTSELSVSVENPANLAQNHRTGNRMAIRNIKERLMLFFDLDARLMVSETKNKYRVFIRMPYRKK